MGKAVSCRNGLLGRLGTDEGTWQHRPVTACIGKVVKAERTGYAHPFPFTLRGSAAACFDGWMAALPGHLRVPCSFPLIFQAMPSFPVLPGWPFAEAALAKKLMQALAAPRGVNRPAGPQRPAVFTIYTRLLSFFSSCFFWFVCLLAFCCCWFLLQAH